MTTVMVSSIEFGSYDLMPRQMCRYNMEMYYGRFRSVCLFTGVRQH